MICESNEWKTIHYRQHSFFLQMVFRNYFPKFICYSQNRLLIILKSSRIGPIPSVKKIKNKPVVNRNVTVVEFLVMSVIFLAKRSHLFVALLSNSIDC